MKRRPRVSPAHEPQSPQVVSAPVEAFWSRYGVAVAILVLVAAIAAVYANSFAGPFFFDDEPSIVKNETIRQLWPIWSALTPPSRGEAVQRRPVVNLSLAINYAVSGQHEWSYHLLNMAAHIAAALLLFGLVRRTLLLPDWRERWETAATPLAFTVALLWGVHPLLTEAVTYIVQRTEVLAGLFYLLTLYCVLRGATSPRAVVWYAGSVFACALAMGSKESALSAPLMALFYDRVFLSPSWKELFRRRWGLYLGLASTWAVIVVMLPHGGEKTAIFGDGSHVWEYASAQFGAIAHYLWLSVWPQTLVVDYGTYQPQAAGAIVPYALLIVALWAGIVYALFRQPWLGFLGLCFFAILAPSSSVVPLPQQIAAEKRMYLPLAAVLTALVFGLYWLGQRFVQRGWLSRERLRVVNVLLVGSVALALGARAIARNQDYHSWVAIWRSAVEALPNNARALYNLGLVLNANGQPKEAMVCYERALRLDPTDTATLNNLGLLFVEYGEPEKGILLLNRVIQLQPDHLNAHSNLGIAYRKLGRTADAIAEFRRVLDVDPAHRDAARNLNILLHTQGIAPEKLAEYRAAVARNPEDADAQLRWGAALAANGQAIEALQYLRKAAALRPDDAEICYNLGLALADAEHWADAIAAYEKVLRLKPDHTDVRYNLAVALVACGRYGEAAAHYRAGLKAEPDAADIHNNLARLLATCPDAAVRNGAEAISLAQRAVELSGEQNPVFLDTLAAAYAEDGQFAAAVKTAQQAMALAVKQQKPTIAKTIESHLRLYEAHTPYREQ